MNNQIQKARLTDQEARLAVQTQLDRNLLLEAGAGSGKTSAMAGRFLELLSSGTAELSDIVAITFTKKAANELQERIRRKLAEAGNPLADQLHESYIGTIHAFCGKLLRERPIEAGVDPQFSELDEAEDQSIRDRVWEEFVMNADAGGSEILERLDLFDLSTDALKHFLKIVCDNPDLEFQLPGEKASDLGGLLKEVDQVYKELVRLIESTLEHIPSLEKVSAGKRDALQLTIEISLPKIRRRQPLSAVEKIHLLKWFHSTTKIKVTQKCWGDDKEAKQRGKEIGEDFDRFKNELVAPLFERRGQYGYNCVAVPFVKEARQIYLDRKKALSVLNFQDLLQISADLLANHKEVRQFFQGKYKYILVDEFQDTDPVQARLLMYLTGKELTEKRWEAITPRPGSLFVVGDPKQSIYSFRRADISMYQRFKERIRETGGDVVEFTTNFRSVNQLGGWFNRIFPELFQKEQDSLQAIFTRADTVQESLEGALSGVYKYKIDNKSGRDGSLMDIDHIERIIRYLTSEGTISVPAPGGEPGAMVQRKIEYRDFLVLFQKKMELTDYGKELSRRGIPVKTTGADVIKRTQKFQALSDVIRMLAYPEENALLYKVLRGPIFRYTDKELFTFAELGGRFNIYQDMEGLLERAGSQNELPGGAADQNEILTRIRLTYELLRRFASYMRVMVPAAATERIVDELGMMAGMLSSRESLTEISSFVSLIEKIRMNKLTNVWDLNQFVEEVNLMVEAGYEEELDLEGEGYNAIRMMNLHKAKGLEAPIVILATPYRGKTKQPDFYVDRSGQLGPMDYGITRIKLSKRLFSKEYISPAAWNVVSGIALARAKEERDRLLYVAATRAGNALIISDSSAADNPWETLLLNSGDQTDTNPTDLDKIIVDSGFVVDDSIREAEAVRLQGDRRELGQSENKLSLNEILERTRSALAEQIDSYQLYTPSEKTQRATGIKESEGEAITQDTWPEPYPETDPADLILQNSMEIHMEGDQEEFRRIRTKLGTAIHLVLEGLIRGDRDQEQLIRFIVQRMDEQSISEKILRDVYRQFAESNLYKRLKASLQVYTEVPVSVKISAGESFLGMVYDRDCYVSGSIDLVFLEEDGWTIVDYKTCSHSQVKNDLVKQYQPQLDAYKEAWEKATGAIVASTEIFFIEKN